MLWSRYQTLSPFQPCVACSHAQTLQPSVMTAFSSGLLPYPEAEATNPYLFRWYLSEL
jgi:hypothetical protein